MDTFYVYHLIDPRTNLPFYIGKGIGDRMYHHVNSVINKKIPNKNKFLFNKIKKLLTLGYSVIYEKVYDNLTEQLAFQKESEEIRKYEIKRVGGILCNLSYGGEGMKGYKFTPNQLKKHQKRMKEVHSTNDSKLRNSKRTKEFYNLHPEQREKLSSIQKRLWQSGKYNNSKSWSFISPTGKLINFTNLQEFCKINKLQQSNMIHVSKGKRKQHKGWKSPYL